MLASFRHFSSVYRIATHPHDGFGVGDVVWKLGGRDSDFTFPAAGDTGPCAQHTARMLPDGNVLMYDNGSWTHVRPALCVDQTDPLGPPVERIQTRVIEYALDTTAAHRHGWCGPTSRPGGSRSSRGRRNGWQRQHR